MIDNNYLILLLVCLTFGGYFFIPVEYVPTYIGYFFVLITSLFLLKNNTENKVLYYLAFVSLSLVLAFRDHMGIDDSNYEFRFNYASHSQFFPFLMSTDQEKGFLAYEFIINKLVFGNYYCFQIITTLLTLFLWGNLISKVKNESNLLILVFFLWTNWYFWVLYAGVIRIFLAIPIALHSVLYVLKNEWIKAFVVICLAATIHTSSLFMLILLIFKNDNCYLFWKRIIIFPILVMPILFIVLAKFIIPYLGSRHAGVTLQTLGYSLGGLNLLPFLLIGGYSFNTIDGEYSKKLYVIGLFLISCSIGVSTFGLMIPELGRLIYYGNWGIPLVAGILYYNQKRESYNTLFLLLFLLYGFLYIMFTAYLNPQAVQHLFPYRSFIFIK